MTRTRTGVAAAVASLIAGGLLVAPAPSGAAPATDPTTVVRKLVSPLSMAVARDGTAYVSQNFAGLLTAVRPGGRPEVVFAAPRKTEVGAVSVGGGLVRFATTAKKHAALWSMQPGGSPTEVADLYRYEKSQNPDADQSYGFTDLDPTCLAQVPAEVPAAYTGVVDSHPYGTAVRRGTTYVADDAANAILAVSPRGKVSTVAVLPAVAVVITADAATANGLPACTVGHAYAFEPVPTDVEVRGGWLYVSLLPGGPEDGSAGANGMVVKVRASSGKVRTVASGFAGTTGVAVARNGDVYVAQLFGGQVSRVRRGSDTAKPFATVKMPAAVEWVDGQVLVSANVLADGPKGRVLAY